MDLITSPLLTIPEEHNFSLKFKDEHLPDNQENLLKRFKSDLKLPNSPLFFEDHFSKKLLQLMTREDKVTWDLIDTIKPDDQWAFTETILKITQSSFT